MFFHGLADVAHINMGVNFGAADIFVAGWFAVVGLVAAFDIEIGWSTFDAGTAVVP